MNIHDSPGNRLSFRRTCILLPPHAGRREAVVELAVNFDIRAQLASAPESFARDGRTLSQSLEFSPDHLRVDAARTHVDAEPAVYRGHDVVPADEIGVAADALC